MPEQLFVKRGRKYVPITPTDGWTGFPCSGVWLVQRDLRKSSAACIMQLGELPDVYPFASMAMSRDELATQITKVLDRKDWRFSSQELADEILKFFAMNATTKHRAIIESQDPSGT